MIRQSGLMLIGAIVLAAAACSGDDSPGGPNRPGRGGSGGEAAGDGATGGLAGTGSGGLAGASGAGAGGGDAGAAGSAGAGGATTDPDAGAGAEDGGVIIPGLDAGTPTGPVCPAQVSFSVTEPIEELDTGAVEIPLAMTPDELTLLFSRGQGAGRTLYLAERSDASAAFTASTLAIPSGYDTAGATLSPDGLQLVLVSTDSKRFGQLGRTARGESFGTLDELPFSPLNNIAIHAGSSFTSPVIAPTGDLLFFTDFSASSSLVRRAERSSTGEWSNPMPEDALWFAGTGAARKLVTGLSSDLRTLFFYDENSSEQLAVWRQAPGSPFDQSRVFAGFRGAIPNQACDTLYTSVDGELVRARPADDPDGGAGDTAGQVGASP